MDPHGRSRSRAAVVAGGAVAGLLAGCLSEPVGLDLRGGGAWPPPGARVQALAGGPLDAAGAVDLVAISTGDATTGVFLLRGGDDLSSAGATTFTAFTPIEGVAAPVAAMIVQAHVVVVSGAAGGHVWVLDSALAVVTEAALDGPPNLPADVPLAVRPSSFGAPGGAAAFALPGSAGFVEFPPGGGAAVRDVLTMPPAAAADATLLAGHTEGLILASPTAIRASGPPTGAPPTFTFTDLRAGAAWLAQTTSHVDIDGTADAIPDVLGIERLGPSASLCIQSGSGTPATPACLPVAVPDAVRARLLHEDVGGGAMEADLVVLHDVGGVPQLGAAPNLVIDGGLAMSGAMITPVTLTGFRNPVMTTVEMGQLMPRGLFVASETGELRCFRLAPTRLEACPAP